MVYDCGSCLVKYVLCGFNFLIFIAGTVVLSVGIWLLVDMNSFIGLMKVIPAENLETFSSPAFIQQATYILIGIGAFTFLLSFLGYCGALKESQCMLTLYGILLILILLVEIAAGIVAAIYKTKVEDQTRILMKNSLEEFYNSTDTKDAITLAWDVVQKNLKCCGVEGGEDYQLNNAWKDQSLIIPPSCCVLTENNNSIDPNCTTSPNDLNSFYNMGCFRKIISTIGQNANLIIIIASVLGLIEIVGILFSFCLAKSVTKYEK